VWAMALGGILPFLPVYGQGSGMPQTPQPRQYADFSRAKVRGNTLWIPPDRGVQYRWSPYVINGFTSLNSPSDAIGPTMAEWVAPGTARVQARLANAFMAGQAGTVEALAPLLGVGTVAIAADSLGPLGEWTNPQIVGAKRTFRALSRRGFVRLREDARDDRVHLVTGTTAPPLPEIGIYDAPIGVGGFDNFMWFSILSGGRANRYVPVAADEPAGAIFGNAPLRSVAPPAVRSRTIPIGAFEHYGACREVADADVSAGGARPPAGTASLVIRTRTQPRCLSMTLRNIRAVAALTVARVPAPAVASADGPPDPIRVEIIYDRNPNDADWIDPTQPAQEVPLGARTATLVVRIAPHAAVTLRGVTLRWADRAPAHASAPAPTCAASDVAWFERNPLAYTATANVRGRCTLVFRQSFAPIWALFASGGSAKVLGHLQVDGFANGWIVDASGPVTFRIVNRALFAYAGGMLLTIACLLLALGLAIRSQLRRAARRAGRVPSPA